MGLCGRHVLRSTPRNNWLRRAAAAPPKPLLSQRLSYVSWFPLSYAPPFKPPLLKQAFSQVPRHPNSRPRLPCRSNLPVPRPHRRRLRARPLPYPTTRLHNSLHNPRFPLAAAASGRWGADSYCERFRQGVYGDPYHDWGTVAAGREFATVLRDLWIVCLAGQENTWCGRCSGIHDVEKEWTV